MTETMVLQPSERFLESGSQHAGRYVRVCRSRCLSTVCSLHNRTTSLSVFQSGVALRPLNSTMRSKRLQNIIWYGDHQDLIEKLR